MTARVAAPICTPTWKGHVETTRDALIIFEACLQGKLQHCIRRPHDRERNQLIASGNVFVYEEGTSGIKRWTDGIPWSPSRILTNFLIYRQLNNPFPPGEKKRATKRSQRPVKAGDPYAAPIVNGNGSTTSNGNGLGTEGGYPHPSSTPTNTRYEETLDKEDRVLVGSLIDSYEFKDGGLLKKTMTVCVNDVQHHLVSYYSLDDAKFTLSTPREDPKLQDIRCRAGLLNQPKFKVTNFDDPGDGNYDQLENQQTAQPYNTTGLATMRPFGPALHGPFSPQEPSHSGWNTPYTPYPGHIQTPTTISGTSFASMPPTPSIYSPGTIGMMNYPQYPQHADAQNHYPHQPRSQRRNSNQAMIKTEGHPQYQSQTPQQPHYQAQPHQQPQYQAQTQQPQYQANTQMQQYPRLETRQSSIADYQLPDYAQLSPAGSAGNRGGEYNIFTNNYGSMGISPYASQGAGIGSSAQMPFSNQ